MLKAFLVLALALGASSAAQAISAPIDDEDPYRLPPGLISTSLPVQLMWGPSLPPVFIILREILENPALPDDCVIVESGVPPELALDPACVGQAHAVKYRPIPLLP